MTYQEWLAIGSDAAMGGLPVMMHDGAMGLLVQGRQDQAGIQVYHGNTPEAELRWTPWGKLTDLGNGALLESADVDLTSKCEPHGYGYCTACARTMPNFKQTDQMGITICCSHCSRILKWVYTAPKKAGQQ